jgi:uncharacterized Tic20 family protein
MYLYTLIASFICNVAGPVVFLILWMGKRAENPLLNWHGKQLINTWITGFLVSILSGILMGVGVCAGGAMASSSTDGSGAAGGGILIVICYGLAMLFMFIWSAMALVFTIIGMIKAKNGDYYKYPMMVRLLK